MKMACPGLVRALAVTPDCVYCAGAIADKIHIWQVMVGITLLLAHICYVPAGVNRSPVGSGGATLPASVSAAVH